MLTSNKGFEDWGQVLDDEVMTAALIHRRLTHHLRRLRTAGRAVADRGRPRDGDRHRHADGGVRRARHAAGGDAETGAGLVVGGSLRDTVPDWGLTLAGTGHWLLLRETAEFNEWGAGGSLLLDPGAPGHGLALRVTPSWGTTTTGTANL